MAASLNDQITQILSGTGITVALAKAALSNPDPVARLGVIQQIDLQKLSRLFLSPIKPPINLLHRRRPRRAL